MPHGFPQMKLKQYEFQNVPFPSPIDVIHQQLPCPFFLPHYAASWREVQQTFAFDSSTALSFRKSPAHSHQGVRVNPIPALNLQTVSTVHQHCPTYIYEYNAVFG